MVFSTWLLHEVYRRFSLSFWWYTAVEGYLLLIFGDPQLSLFVTCHAFAQGWSLRSLVTTHNKAFILYNAFDLRRKPRIIVLSAWLQEFKWRSCEFAWRDNGDEQLLDSMTVITQSIRSREKGCLHRIRIVHQQLNNRTWLIYMDIKHGEIFANRIM